MFASPTTSPLLVPPTVPERDVWNWLVLWTTVIGFGFATATFIVWLLTNRRRPELQFLWEYKRANPETFSVWEPDDILGVHPGERLDIKGIVSKCG